VANVFNAYGPLTSNTDGNGHGTHVAGTIGGNKFGVANRANILGLKVLDDSGGGYTSDIILGLEKVVELVSISGRRSVMSMSLGGSCGNTCISDPLNVAVENLVNIHDCIGVVAAGNDNADASKYAPASALYVVTVAASNILDQKASFSNYGATVEIFAPGVDIRSACSSTNQIGTCQVDPVNGPYLVISGTSMSTPFVSGVLAQILQKFPLAPKNAIKDELYCISSKGYLSGLNSATLNRLLRIPVASAAICTIPPVYAPTLAPTASLKPAAIPTPVPSMLTFGPTIKLTFGPTIMPTMQASYAAANTNSALQNYVLAGPYYVCSSFTATLCSSTASVRGDTFLRLVDSKGVQLASNDDSCGLASKIVYSPPICGISVTLRMGCYSSLECSGTVAINFIPASSRAPTLLPSRSPTKSPTLFPSKSPTYSPSLLQTRSPTFAPTQTNLYYSAVNTNSALQNYVLAGPYYVCSSFTATLCSSTASVRGDTFLRLVDSKGVQLASNDDSCGLASKIVYSPPICGISVTLRMGCYSSLECSGTVAINFIPASSRAPTLLPSRSPSRSPTKSPSRAPTRVPKMQ
jgi:hypothetical protein